MPSFVLMLPNSVASSLFSATQSLFLPFLYPALKAHEDTQLCTVAIGVIGDISRALGEQSVQYAGPFMQVLLENLSSEALSRNVKVHCLSCFGDIALAIGPAFEPFLSPAMAVLRQAGSLQVNPVCFLSLSIVLAFWLMVGFWIARSRDV